MKVNLEMVGPAMYYEYMWKLLFLTPEVVVVVALTILTPVSSQIGQIERER